MIGLLRQTSKNIDLKVMCFLQKRIKKTWLDQLIPILTQFGGATFIISATVLFSLIQQDSGYSLLILAVSHLIVHFLKKGLDRVRPYLRFQSLIELRSKGMKDASFPSGHTAAAFTFATIVSHAYPGLAWICYALASIVGWSRIYLGLHYPTDVCVGVIIGLSVPFLFL